MSVQAKMGTPHQMPGQGAPFEDKGETGQTTEADRSSRADYEKTWCGMLAGLKKVAES